MTVTGSAFCASKSHRYRAVPPLLFPSPAHPTSTARHHAPPCLSKARREPDPNTKLLEPLGFAVTSDKNMTLEQSLALPQSTGALLVPSAGLGSQPASLHKQLTVWWLEHLPTTVKAAKQDKKCWLFSFYFSPPLTTLPSAFLIASSWSSPALMILDPGLYSPFFISLSHIQHQLMVTLAVAKLGHPHPVLSAWLGSQNPALCSLSHLLTPAFLKMLHYTLSGNKLMFTFIII